MRFAINRVLSFCIFWNIIGYLTSFCSRPVGLSFNMEYFCRKSCFITIMLIGKTSLWQHLHKMVLRCFLMVVSKWSPVNPVSPTKSLFSFIWNR